jgi:drug/metabolite transporter (DMT)-like permease
VTSIRAARRTDGAWEVFAAFCVLGLLCTAPVALARWQTPTLGDWGLLVAVGLISVAAQVLMTYALGAVEAALSGIIAQIAVIAALALGYFLDGEPLTAISFAGAVLTLGGVSLAAHVSAKPTTTYRGPNRNADDTGAPA